MCHQICYPIVSFSQGNLQKTHLTQILVVVVVVIQFSQPLPGTIITRANMNTAVSRRIFGGKSLHSLSLSLLAGTTNTSESGERCGRAVVRLSVCLSVCKTKQTNLFPHHLEQMYFRLRCSSYCSPDDADRSL